MVFRRALVSISRIAVSVAILMASLFISSAAQASSTDCKSYAYACTPGYTGANAASSWSWRYYGASIASTATGYHNCTLYAAWRLAQNGMADPGRSWGNAADWASRIGGGSHSPAVGAIAWWGTEVGRFGHVAYVEQVSGANVYIRADNFAASGFTTAGWIPASSVDLFLHPHDVGGTISDGSFVRVRENGQVYRVAGGAPLYVSNWAVFGGVQPVIDVSLAQLSAMRPYPADGTFVATSPRGEVYRIAGGAPLYVSNWAVYGGAQPTTTVDAGDIDNAGAGSVWNHLRTYPADGTFVLGVQSSKIYKVARGAARYVPTWDIYGGQQPYTPVDQGDIDNAGAGGVWNHLIPAVPVVGDLNSDGYVGCADQAVLQAHFGETPAGPGHGDLNSDGIINVVDLSILLSHWAPPPGDSC